MRGCQKATVLGRTLYPAPRAPGGMPDIPRAKNRAAETHDQIRTQVEGGLLRPLAIDGAAGVRSAVPLVRGRIDDAAWDHSVFSKNRERLLEGDIVAKLLSGVLAHPRVKRLLRTDHFSVDGTLIEAWASMKSFKPKDGSDEPPADGDGRNREADFHGARTTPTPRLPIQRRGSIAKGLAKRPSSASWGMP